MKLLVRNLAKSTLESDLATMFEAIGTVQSCSLVMDKSTGQSKGFGFVEMPKQGEAKAAIKTLNGKKLSGNKIRVKKAEETTPTPPKQKDEAADTEQKDETADTDQMSETADTDQKEGE